METQEAIPWDRLSESSRAYIIGLVRRLANGYSGEIIVICNDGGVRDLRETRKRDAGDFERYP